MDRALKDASCLFIWLSISSEIYVGFGAETMGDVCLGSSRAGVGQLGCKVDVFCLPC